MAQVEGVITGGEKTKSTWFFVIQIEKALENSVVMVSPIVEI